jgi:glutamate transport system permease protein
MSRALEDVLRRPDPQGAGHHPRRERDVAAALLALIAPSCTAFRMRATLGDQEFFAWETTWVFWAKVCSARWPSGSVASSLVLGLVLLVGRLSRLRIARWPAVAVIEFLRGVPTLLLIYVCFLVLPSVGIKLSAYWMLTLPVGLSTAAVVAEVYRAGVLAVPRGQTDAARALGLSKAQVFASIVFPQAFRHIVPALVAQPSSW